MIVDPFAHMRRPDAPPCPNCGSHSKCIETRKTAAGSTRRRRKCNGCGLRFSTLQIGGVEVLAAMVEAVKAVEVLAAMVEAVAWPTAA